ncbi:hypothetical protein PR048_016950 [Dryococelus australis]|uniref:Uncharacterized protein n=1 Tax=Dryococelus australis TaxID=614101 RepID=A0ABQ9H8D1_9NEOP|nr:hypothetical protein PR048_016950 [Dryococelus australis]
MVWSPDDLCNPKLSNGTCVILQRKELTELWVSPRNVFFVRRTLDHRLKMRKMTGVYRAVAQLYPARQRSREPHLRLQPLAITEINDEWGYTPLACDFAVSAKALKKYALQMENLYDRIIRFTPCTLQFNRFLFMDPARVKRGEYGAALECKGGREKTRRPAPSSGTIPTCGNPGTTPPESNLVRPQSMQPFKYNKLDLRSVGLALRRIPCSNLTIYQHARRRAHRTGKALTLAWQDLGVHRIMKMNWRHSQICLYESRLTQRLLDILPAMRHFVRSWSARRKIMRRESSCESRSLQHRDAKISSSRSNVPVYFFSSGYCVTTPICLTHFTSSALQADIYRQAMYVSSRGWSGNDSLLTSSEVKFLRIETVNVNYSESTILAVYNTSIYAKQFPKPKIILHPQCPGHSSSITTDPKFPFGNMLNVDNTLFASDKPNLDRPARKNNQKCPLEGRLTSRAMKAISCFFFLPPAHPFGPITAEPTQELGGWRCAQGVERRTRKGWSLGFSRHVAPLHTAGTRLSKGCRLGEGLSAPPTHTDREGGRRHLRHRRLFSTSTPTTLFQSTYPTSQDEDVQQACQTTSQKQSSDTRKAPYDRVKRCRERKINIKAPERLSVDVRCPRFDSRSYFQESQRRRELVFKAAVQQLVFRLGSLVTSCAVCGTRAIIRFLVTRARTKSTLCVNPEFVQSLYEISSKSVEPLRRDCITQRQARQLDDTAGPHGRSLVICRRRVDVELEGKSCRNFWLITSALDYIPGDPSICHVFTSVQDFGNDPYLFHCLRPSLALLVLDSLILLVRSRYYEAVQGPGEGVKGRTKDDVEEKWGGGGGEQSDKESLAGAPRDASIVEVGTAVTASTRRSITLRRAVIESFFSLRSPSHFSSAPFPPFPLISQPIGGERPATQHSAGNVVLNLGLHRKFSLKGRFDLGYVCGSEEARGNRLSHISEMGF